MAAKSPSTQRLHFRLVKSKIRRYDKIVDVDKNLSTYRLRGGLGFTGRLYVSPPSQSPPLWLEFVRTGVSEDLRELSNRTNAAVLVARRGTRIFALTFGHGRHLLREEALEADFGLRTALNALQPTTLRSIDAFTIEDQTIHRRAQASRASGLEVFGVDVERDILRAVTGEPWPDLDLRAVTGVGPSLAVSAKTDFSGLGPLMDRLLTLFRRRTYRQAFSWVDNIRSIADPAVLGAADQALVRDLQKARPKAYLAPPEPVDWESIDGFEYTHRRRAKETDLAVSDYLEGVVRRIGKSALDPEVLKRHKVFIFRGGSTEPSGQWKLYDCIVFETSIGSRRYVLTSGRWFEINRDFVQRIRAAVRTVPIAVIGLPRANLTQEGKAEAEAEYNRRVAEQDPATALLDRKLARCQSASSGIEICDLLTGDGQLIHVKHRKGGSSSLSHLFAQARVSAEALAGDETFRQDARRILRELNQDRESWIPAERPAAGSFTVVLAIIGLRDEDPGDDLPFFSQVNLVQTYRALTVMGYGVGLTSIPIGA